MRSRGVRAHSIVDDVPHVWEELVALAREVCVARPRRPKCVHLPPRHSCSINMSPAASPASHGLHYGHAKLDFVPYHACGKPRNSLVRFGVGKCRAMKRLLAALTHTHDG